MLVMVIVCWCRRCDVDCCGWTEQVSIEWTANDADANPRVLQRGAIECQQSTLSHHARKDHTSEDRACCWVDCGAQVLNMKPPEILAMLEEVAGTRMYEEKRLRAFQTFDKKTQKLKEFDEALVCLGSALRMFCRSWRPI